MADVSAYAATRNEIDGMYVNEVTIRNFKWENMYWHFYRITNMSAWKLVRM